LPEVLKVQADRFSESDLVRLFHSLADTETKLKDAIQSRYVLEIGLVKLIELRRLSSVEELLNRLNVLEARLGDGSLGDSETAAVAAGAEKKTLKSDLTLVRSDSIAANSEVLDPVSVVSAEEPDLGIGYRDLGEPHEPEPISSEVSSPLPASASYEDLGFVASLPVKLPPIRSEDLEHFDDKALDAQYNRKLEVLDEGGGPIPGASEILRRAIGYDASPVRAATGANGSAAAPARAPLNIQIPDLSPEVAVEELPWPGDEASDEELFAYANSRHSVRLVKRVFRGKVTSITRTEQ